MKNLLWIVKISYKYLKLELVTYSLIGLLHALFTPLQLTLYEKIVLYISSFSLSKAFYISAILCCAIICNSLFSRILMLIQMKSEHKAKLRFTDDILKYVYAHDITFLDEYKSLLLVEKAKNCADNIIVAFIFQLIEFFQLVIAALSLIIMIWNRSKIAVVLFLFMSLIQNIYVIKSAVETSNVNKQAFEKRYKIDYITSLFFNKPSFYEIKFFDLAEWLLKKHHNIFLDLKTILTKHYTKWTKINTLWSMVMFAIEGIILFILSIGYISTKINISTLMFLIQSQTTLISTITQIIATFSDLLKRQDDFSSLFKITQETSKEKSNDIFPEKSITNSGDSSIAISCQNLSFFYHNVQALHDISFQVLKKQHVAIVGKNGSGKSTLAKIILQQISTYYGNLYVFTDNFSAAFQDFGEFYFSIKDCITMSEKEIDYEKILGLTNQFKELNIFNDMFNHLDTLLGSEFHSDGINLSGGEWQKLSVLRALYRDSSIYVFDESTSKMDPASQLNIHAKIKNYLKDCNVLTITHRVGLASDADLIFYMHEGQIVESGTHNSLLKFNGYYKALYDAQFEGDIF